MGYHKITKIKGQMAELDDSSEKSENNVNALEAKADKAEEEQKKLLQNYLGRVKRASLRDAKLRYMVATVNGVYSE